MAKERLISTRFWSDGWVRSINPLDRYLFMYLLTNEHTNIAGIYELPLSTMAFESGIDERDLERSMLPKLAPKAYYKDGWVILTNFLKHQHTSSSTVLEGVKRELNQAPEVIIQYAHSIGYGEGMDTLWVGYNILNLTKPNLTSPASETPKGVPEFINLFKDINPSYALLFKRPPQRQAAERLLEIHPLEWWQRFMEGYAVVITDRYCPKATTPIQLEENLGRILSFGQSRRKAATDKGNNFII
jgi:hypothetical protein